MRDHPRPINADAAVPAVRRLSYDRRRLLQLSEEQPTA